MHFSVMTKMILDLSRMRYVGMNDYVFCCCCCVRKYCEIKKMEKKGNFIQKYFHVFQRVFPYKIGLSAFQA